MHLAEKLPKQVLLDANLHKMHHIWSIGSHKCDYNCCHRCQNLPLKCDKFQFQLGSVLDPAGGTYSAL